MRGKLKSLPECDMLHRWYAFGVRNFVAEMKLLTVTPYRQDLPHRYGSKPCCEVYKDVALSRNTTSKLEDCDDLHGSIVKIFRDIHSLTRQLDNDTTSVDTASISSSASSIERRILALPMAELPRTQTQHFDYRAEVARLEALLYIKLVFHKMKSSEASLVRLETELLDVHQLWEYHRRATCHRTTPSPPLWILVMAGLHSRGNLKSAWIAERIAKAIARAGLETCEDVEYLFPETSVIERLRCFKTLLDTGVGWRGI